MNDIATIEIFSFLKALLASKNGSCAFGGLHSRYASTTISVCGTAAYHHLFTVHNWFRMIRKQGPHFDGKLHTYFFLYFVVCNFFYVVITSSALHQFKRLMKDHCNIVLLL